MHVQVRKYHDFTVFHHDLGLKTDVRELVEKERSQIKWKETQTDMTTIDSAFVTLLNETKRISRPLSRTTGLWSRFVLFFRFSNHYTVGQVQYTLFPPLPCLSNVLNSTFPKCDAMELGEATWNFKQLPCC